MSNNSRATVGKRAGLIGIIANVLLASGKLFAGIISGAVSIIADSLNNFSDCFSSLITVIGFKASQKPADSDHPFGHARYEYVAGLIISMLVILVGFELVKSSIEKIISPVSVVFSLITAIILAVSALVKLLLWAYNSKLAKAIDSDTLKATSVDCRNDAIVTTLVLITTIIEHYTGLFIDGFMGLAISVFILYSGAKLTLETISPILGKKNDENLKKLILKKINEYPIVIGYHDLMIHDYGPGVSFCSIHFEIDKNLDPLYVHELIDKFEREFALLGVSLTVHYDPVVTDSPELNLLSHTVTSVLVDIDSRLTTHDFRSIPCDGFTKVFFDIPLPNDLLKQKQMITDKVNVALNELGKGCYQAEITFDSEMFIPD